MTRFPGSTASRTRYTPSSAFPPARRWRPLFSATAALLGGTFAAGSHLAKSGSRALINTSPEPLSNIAASFTEEGLLVGGLWLAFMYPLAFLAALAVFMLAVLWMLRRLWRWLRQSRPPAAHV